MVTNNKQTVLEFVTCLVTEYIQILILFEEKCFVLLWDVSTAIK